MADFETAGSRPETADPCSVRFGEFKFRNGGRYRGQYILEALQDGDTENDESIQYRKVIHGEGEYYNKAA
ncbi:hypothetical protein Pmar_PMAR010079 [Perkinsus marinus ATCC 50983]|uniref:Uncharacterized protein n=1 Tax=Perkinsus marinus (strain ATCC 50983 / TXsc) TaxID=423536 RepID=C5K4S2_PERM5|nr:hypothetical protein Pmar_PMAR010079 [Perkinsus marinus ATCC 50983]EER20344.1 hypothetical protein Pmar_PMAR010079 [Perkinsus marinus ATCC 50983]|eukprot:XP_002788548.1 hypothetical protein Pmar_PMAR010079 [Perkinsus marinus ATCC 50983]